MNKPDKPEKYIGRNVITLGGREGVVDSIGCLGSFHGEETSPDELRKLSDDPWIIFDDNAIPIRVTWHQIEPTDDGFFNNFYE